MMGGAVVASPSPGPGPLLAEQRHEERGQARRLLPVAGPSDRLINHPAWSTPVDKQGRCSRPDQADKVWSTLKSAQRCQPSSGVGMERPRRHLRLALNDGQVGTYRGGWHGPCDLVLANRA